MKPGNVSDVFLCDCEDLFLSLIVYDLAVSA